MEEKCVDMATEEENVIEDFEKSSPEEVSECMSWGKNTRNSEGRFLGGANSRFEA